MRSASPVRLQTQPHLRRLFYVVLVAALAGLIISHLTAALPVLRPSDVVDTEAARRPPASASSADAAAASDASASHAGKDDARCLRYGAVKEVGETVAAGALCKLVNERAHRLALTRQNESSPPPPAAAQAGCRRLGDGTGRRGTVGERDAKGLREGVTIVIPTYKGHKTMRNTVGTWQQSGFLRHPEVTDVIVRMNGCTCRDFETMHDDIWGFARKAPYNLNVTVLCGSGNWLFARHLIAAVLEVETTMFIQTENDRPMLRRTNESAADYKARVRSVLDTAIGAVRNGSCGQALPYVHLHRMHMSGADEVMHRAWRESGRPKSARPVELTRPHQKPGDVTECWACCSDVVDEYRAAANKTAYLERGCLSRGATQCRLWVCREFALWVEEDAAKRSGAASDTDTRNRNLICLTTFVRATGVHREGVRRLTQEGRVSTAGEIEKPADWSALHWWAEKRLVRFQREPLLLCYKTAHHVNAPALHRTSHYVSHVAARMCVAPVKSGMSVGKARRVFTKRKGIVVKQPKTYFNHYGKLMEYFLMEQFTNDVACYVDGLTEHVELESYDGNSIDPH